MDWILVVAFFLSSVEDLGFSGHTRVAGRYARVSHDVETSSLRIYDIDLD